MELKRVDHIGIAVKNLEDAVKFYESLGFKATGYETVEEQKVKVAFLPCGDSELELLESTEPDGPIARFIEAPSPTAPSPASSRRTAPASSTLPSGWTTSTRLLRS